MTSALYEPYKPVMHRGGWAMPIPYVHDPNDMLFMPMRTVITADAFDIENQVFSFQPRDAAGNDIGECLHVHIGKLWRMCQADPTMYESKDFGLLPESAAFIRDNHGLERPHLGRILSGESKTKIDQPGLIVLFPDGSQVIADGNHRYVLRWLEKFETMEFWEVTLEKAKPCLLKMPPDMDKVSGESVATYHG